MIGADRVWNELGVRGAGVIVGQSDTGVDGSHPELAAQYRGLDGNNNYNWFDPWNHSLRRWILADMARTRLARCSASMWASRPMRHGLAVSILRARWAILRCIWTVCSSILRRFRKIGDPLRDGKPNLGAMVLNNSWGCPAEEGATRKRCSRQSGHSRAAGVFVVASAGNDGPACSTSQRPACAV